MMILEQPVAGLFIQNKCISCQQLNVVNISCLQSQTVVDMCQCQYKTRRTFRYKRHLDVHHSSSSINSPLCGWRWREVQLKTKQNYSVDYCFVFSLTSLSWRRFVHHIDNYIQKDNLVHLLRWVCQWINFKVKKS